MDGSRIQAKVNRGYAIAASRLGLPHAHFRPLGPGAALDAANRLPRDLPAAFEPNQFSFTSPKRDDTPFWSALVDGAEVRPGDYLLRGEDTWFIAAMDPLLPIRAVRCGPVIAVRRASAASGVGAVGYGGDVEVQEELLLSGWPVGLTLDGRGERTDVRLPSDGRFGSFAAFLPASLPVEVLTGDILEDGRGMRLAVSSVVRTQGVLKVLAQQLTV